MTGRGDGVGEEEEEKEEQEVEKGDRAKGGGAGAPPVCPGGLSREAVEASAVLRGQPPEVVARAAREVAVTERRRRGAEQESSRGGGGGAAAEGAAAARGARQLVFDRVIGRGASGKVYLARLLPAPSPSAAGGREELVAVKQVSLRDTTARALEEVLQLEVRLLRRLRHPHIVRYKGYHASRRHARCNIIIEYVDGGSLQQRLRARGGRPYPLDRVSSIARQVLSGLQYLHAQRVIHRDLKPGNLLVTSEGAVKIADFDVSTQVYGVQTMQRSVVGTPWYTAPEIIQVEPYGARADIWSFGCCILELATGKCPYAGLNEVQAMFRMVQDAHPPIPEALPEALRDFLLLCFRRPANLRPQAADLMRHPFLLAGKGLDRPLSPLQLPTPKQPSPSPVGEQIRFGCPSLEAPLNKGR